MISIPNKHPETTHLDLRKFNVMNLWRSVTHEGIDTAVTRIQVAEIK